MEPNDWAKLCGEMEDQSRKAESAVKLLKETLESSRKVG
jgi:hypothetical protein